jgi:hypothetical protein
MPWDAFLYYLNWVDMHHYKTVSTPHPTIGTWETWKKVPLQLWYEGFEATVPEPQQVSATN